MIGHIIYLSQTKFPVLEKPCDFSDKRLTNRNTLINLYRASTFSLLKPLPARKAFSVYLNMQKIEENFVVQSVQLRNERKCKMTKAEKKILTISLEKQFDTLKPSQL